MIKALYIENFVLIERLDISFDAGLNIITGETGAGKSILLGALSLLLGERTESGVIRDKSKNCIIEGTFQLEGYNLEGLFEASDLEYDPHCIIRRVISPTGKSRSYINDLPAPLSVLKAIGRRLIDIHSQHQTLLLANADFRLEIMDSVAHTEDILSQYLSVYTLLKEKERELTRVQETARQNKTDEDYIRFQYEQLSAARLQEGEMDALESQRNELEHASDIREALDLSAALLDEGEESIMVKMKSACNALEKIAPVSDHVHSLAQRLQSCRIELKDILAEVIDAGERIETDPGKLEKVNERLDLLYGLQQKHHVQTVEELIACRQQYLQRLNDITDFESQITLLRQEIETLSAEVDKRASLLSQKRKEAALAVEKHTLRILRNLGLKDAGFSIRLQDTDPGPKGKDRAEYYFSANRGTALQPLEKVASGGEMSRLMLSLKSLVAAHSSLPTIVFDEIDTGVSGAVADRMGEIIADMGKNMQIINITHLPQVACKGKSHFIVYKKTSADATHTHLRKLSQPERIEEIAKMLSGANVTDAAVQQAKELLGTR